MTTKLLVFAILCCLIQPSLALAQPAVTPADVARLSAPQSVLFNAALIAGGALAGADLAVTMRCVGDGRCYELNPALRPLAPHPMLYGLVKAGASTAALAIISHYGHAAQIGTRRKALIAALVYAGVNAAVVVANARRLGR